MTKIDWSAVRERLRGGPAPELSQADHDAAAALRRLKSWPEGGTVTCASIMAGSIRADKIAGNKNVILANKEADIESIRNGALDALGIRQVRGKAQD